MYAALATVDADSISDAWRTTRLAHTSIASATIAGRFFRSRALCRPLKSHQTNYWQLSLQSRWPFERVLQWQSDWR